MLLSQKSVTSPINGCKLKLSYLIEVKIKVTGLHKPHLNPSTIHHAQALKKQKTYRFSSVGSMFLVGRRQSNKFTDALFKAIFDV